MPASLRVSLAAAIVFAPAAYAEPGGVIDDTVTVTGRALQEAPLQSSRQEIDSEALEQRSALSLSEALELGAAANLTVNSRGETLVYLRNAGERQLAVLFDGALINLPWDNRLSLDLAPASALSGVVVTPGASSVRHGVNSAGGAVELLPAGPEAAGLRLELAAGSGEMRAGSASWFGQSGATGLLLAADHLEGDALTAAGGGDLANSDLRRDSLLLRLSHEAGPLGEASLSLMHVDAEYGVAPARFDRPAQGSPRYWRYPEARQTVAIARLARQAGPVAIKASLWRQDAGQTLDSYAGLAFTTLEDRLETSDLATGARLEGAIETRRGVLHLGLSGLGSRHDETEIAYGAAPAVTQARYSDRRSSLFAEYETQWGAVDLAFGLSRDRLDPRQTGGRPASGAFDGTNWTTAAGWSPSSDWRLRAAASRKTRLPTLRELFGTAIDRFAPNPDLAPERIDSLEASAIWTDGRGRVELTPFYSRISDAIDQRNITLGGRSLRQRVNLRGATVWGLEARADYRLSEAWSVSGHALSSRPRRLSEPGAMGPRLLSERPELIARLALDYAGESGWEAGLELQHRGRAYSFTDEDLFEPLARSTELNLRASWAPEEAGWRIWGRLDNATDERVEPQLGLEAPGRAWRFGVGTRF